MGFIMLAALIGYLFIQYLKKLDSQAQSKQVSQQPQPPSRSVSSAQKRPERPVSTAYHNSVQHAKAQNSVRDTDRVYERDSSADDRYTAQGCGCCSSEDAGSNRSSAYYDESRFYEEAQKSRKGKWS